MTLNEIPVGGVCTVTKLNGTGKLRRRIMDMGITKGRRGRHPQGGRIRV